MSQSSAAGPTPTPLPGQTSRQDGDNEAAGRVSQSGGADVAKSHVEWPSIRLRLEIADVTHTGARRLLEAAVSTKSTHEKESKTVLEVALENVLRELYDIEAPEKSSNSGSSRAWPLPECRSITVKWRPISGVAYTVGSELDNAQKEIHVSMGYIAGVKHEDSPKEILGVLTHEMVHCLQHSRGGPPSGLIEGLADWVRLRAGLAPGHWHRRPAGKGPSGRNNEGKEKGKERGGWDQGYAITAWFLDWLDEKHLVREQEEGVATPRPKRRGDVVREINQGLSKEHNEGGYGDGKYFWKSRFGKEVGELWADYLDWLDNEA